MKKYLKLVSAALAVIAVVLMFFTQVTVKWTSGHTESIGIQALVGGTYSSEWVKGVSFSGTGAGLAGYILLGVGALILLLAALVPYFKEHDVLGAVVTGLAVICLIVGVFLVFFIRKNFANTNGYESDAVYVGWAAITAGSLGSISALFGALGVALDVAGNN